MEQLVEYYKELNKDAEYGKWEVDQVLTLSSSSMSSSYGNLTEVIKVKRDVVVKNSFCPYEYMTRKVLKKVCTFNLMCLILTDGC